MTPLCIACSRHHDRTEGCYRLKPKTLIPVPEGMTYADAEAALADAGAWVEVDSFADVSEGARLRNDWRNGDSGNDVLYVHRDDLPPADPDAELVEKMARAIYEGKRPGSWVEWEDLATDTADDWRGYARAALAVVREHEAKS